MKTTNVKSNQGKKHSYKLRTKLIASFLGVSLLGIIFVGAVSVNNIYRFSRREVERNSVANLKSALDNTMDYLLELRAESIRPETGMPKGSYQSNIGVRELLQSGETSYENWFEFLMQLNTSKAKTGVDSLFYMNEERVFSLTDDTEMSFDYMMGKSWFSQWYRSDKTYAWGAAYVFRENSVVPYVRKIFSHGEVIGISLLNIKESFIRDYWKSYGNMILLNEENYVLSARYESMLGVEFSEIYDVDLSELPSGSSLTIKYHNNTYHGVFYRENVYGMGMVELLPQSEAGTVVTDMLQSTLGVLAAVVILCGVLAIFLSSKITRPLQNVTEIVDSLKLDAAAVELPIISNDEIGILMESINNMTRRLEESRKEILEISDARRLAEYRAIQLQINPHFLYNTLSSINWFAEQNQPENVKKVAESLSQLFRISVNHGREMLHIIEEIQHVRCYLDIQMLRHKDEFTYQIDVDPEILSYYTIKIILQPLVENSLYHGIRENGISKGIIRIAGQRKGDNIELLVIDNGNTPQEEIDRMNAVLQNPDSREDDGIGMLNVHNRICYFYQSSYGLRYEKNGEYTVARIELPVIEVVEEE